MTTLLPTNLTTTMSPGQIARLIQYDPDAGTFKWLPRNESSFATTQAFKAWRGRYEGKETSCTSGGGYAVIRVGGKLFYAHRIAWAIMTGDWPDSQIDHIDGNRLNNRFCNLRVATASENARNHGISRSNTSGVTGVYLDSNRGKWVSEIMINLKKIHLGSFTEFEDAVAARRKAEITHHGSYRPRSPRPSKPRLIKKFGTRTAQQQ